MSLRVLWRVRMVLHTAILAIQFEGLNIVLLLDENLVVRRRTETYSIIAILKVG